MKVRLYNSAREHFVTDPRVCAVATIYSSNEDIGSSIPAYQQAGHVTTDPGTCVGNKIPRFIRSVTGSSVFMSSNPTEILHAVNAAMDTLRETTCEGYRPYWEAELRSSCLELTAGQMTDILDGFQEICMAGVDSLHPDGASTLPPGATGYTFHSFQEVLNHHAGVAAGTLDPFCNAYGITAPRPYDAQSYLQNPVVYPNPPTCTCERLDSLVLLYFIETGEATLADEADLHMMHVATGEDVVLIE